MTCISFIFNTLAENWPAETFFRLFRHQKRKTQISRNYAIYFHRYFPFFSNFYNTVCFPFPKCFLSFYVLFSRKRIYLSSPSPSQRNIPIGKHILQNIVAIYIVVAKYCCNIYCCCIHNSAKIQNKELYSNRREKLPLVRSIPDGCRYSSVNSVFSLKSHSYFNTNSTSGS